ncbi:ATP-binding cassette domain-containing protein [Paracrocinitomix mangrovi]|uniref:ATP-binding cassette domain-containing protein n=1 Tax=Paracrocinitomix mangrovi TaxID=2862509 RepID=UPI001C8E0001|nr:ATP-binding cassette domain-containing protein [Paracrocinitomix mangrovi]UKN01611.1 ATP-binding cassette domain-containing protein [Paracrocinitomix mangrovi]
MSEEILKALMQLFAIISKQEDGGNKNHDEFVKEFLLSQISIDRFDTYFDQYVDYKNQQQTTTGGVTSVKDSVRTLSICKRINKTLSQKQKSVVLVRICEFIYVSENDSGLRLEIVETIGKIFKIDKDEFARIIEFSAANTLEDIKGNKDIQIHLDPAHHAQVNTDEVFVKEGIQNILFFCYIESANLILFRFWGEESIHLNGLQVKPIKIHILTDGATIRTNKGSVFFNEVLNNFRAKGDIKEVVFNASIPTHTWKGGKVALKDIEVIERSGTLFGIMGGSGAGKTTMLNILSGQLKSPEADIKLNGHDITTEEARSNIGYIPQDDLLMEELTVYQNLYYNAKLINGKWSEEEIEERIMKVLSDLGLAEIKDIKVGNALNKKISGGQRKRLNIALELIREPLVLFVDEPTSGLSSKDSENVMDLLKLLSHSGKIIFVVIHQPSSEIFKLFDKLMILDLGGLPVYYGNPIESVIYFKTLTNQINQEKGECEVCGNVNPEQIFDTLEDKEVDEFGNYTEHRKITPIKWNEFYRDKIAIDESPKQLKVESLDKIGTPSLLKQFKVFFTRDFLSRISDKQYLLIALLEAPVLAFVLSFVIRSASVNSETYAFGLNQNIPAYIFMLVIVALFVGLTISAEEIFKDQKILKREQFLRLSRLSYLGSKTIYLILLSALQSFLLVLVGNLVLEIHENFLVYWLIIFSVFVFGNITGLILSSSFKSIVTIYIVIPLIIIPQMILGGAMFKFVNLNKIIGGGYRVPVISRLMISNWAYESIMVAQFTDNAYQKEFYEYDQLLSDYTYRTAYLYPYLEDLLNEQSENGDSETSVCSATVLNTLNFEIKRSGIEGDQQLNFSDNSIEQAYAIVEFLTDYYKDKYNNIIRLKDEKIRELQQSYSKEVLLNMRNQSFNNDVAEITQNTLTENRYFVEDDFVYQNYDHVFMRDHLHPDYPGKGNFMYENYKSVFGKSVSAFWFNMSVIWLFNIGLFVMLYFNVLKKLMSLI